MKIVKKDPRMILVKYPCTCSRCGIRLHKGDQAYYWPASGDMYCVDCGEADYRRYLSDAFDEEVYKRTGNPYYC
jgi:hypothetical protein